ncbi:MAG: murein biosynthesis integral membrane protein MurJ [Candidatus Promineifilaceae bacterium]
MSRTRHLLQSSVLVMVLAILNKVTGLYRVRLSGQVFGTGVEWDAWTAANQLPELFFVLIAGGALAAAFIPVYTSYLYSEDQKRAKDSANLANTTLTMVLMVLTAVCGVAAIFALPITRNVLVPGVSAEQQLLIASLMRIVLLNTLLFGVSGVITSLLQANQHFLLPAAAPIMLDIGYIIGIFVLVPTMGIAGVAWGTVIGAALHIAIQIPALIRYRLKIRPKFDFHLAGIHEIVRLMGPRLIMLGAIQAADIFWVRIASTLEPGQVSGYSFAWTLQQVPETLFGTTIALVIFPTMSELFNKGDIAGLKQTAMQTLRIIWLLTIPSAAGLILLGRPVIQLFLEGDAFDERSTAIVFSALVFLSVRVVSEATIEIVARLFYARHDTYTPMWGYLLWLVVNVAAIYAFVGSMGAAGIALASTLAFTVLAVWLYWRNRVELGDLQDRQMLFAFGRISLATIFMSIAMFFVMNLPLGLFPMLALSAIMGGVVFLAANWLLGGRELQDLFQLASR